MGELFLHFPVLANHWIHGVHGITADIQTVSILVTITALLRGPLMQRASYVQVVGVSQNSTIDLPVNYNISSLWGGKMSGLGSDYMELVEQFSPGFSDVVRDYLDKAPIRIPGAHCENCTLTIKVRDLPGPVTLSTPSRYGIAVPLV